MAEGKELNKKTSLQKVVVLGYRSYCYYRNLWAGEE